MIQLRNLLNATIKGVRSIALAVFAVTGVSSAGAVVMPLNLQSGDYEFTAVGCLGSGFDCEGTITVSEPDPNFQIDLSDLSRINGVDSFNLPFPSTAQTAFLGSDKSKISLYGDRQTLHVYFDAFCPGCYDFNNPPSLRIQSFSLYTSSSLSSSLPEGIIFLNRVEEKQTSELGSYIDLKIYTGYLEVRKIMSTAAEVVFAEPQLTVDQQAAFEGGVLDLISEEILAVLSPNPPEVSLLDVWNALPPDSLRVLQRSIAGDQITEFPITFPAPARVPEPGTVALLALGIAGLAFSRWRRQ